MYIIIFIYLSLYKIKFLVESELVSGFMTEHSAVIFVFFFLAEYASIVLICILTSILFLGGYLNFFYLEVSIFNNFIFNNFFVFYMYSSINPLHFFIDPFSTYLEFIFMDFENICSFYPNFCSLLDILIGKWC